MYAQDFLAATPAAGELLAGMSRVVSGSQQVIDFTIPAHTTTYPTNFNLDPAALQGIFLVADQPGTVQFDGNFGVQLFAGEPFVWHIRGGLDCPFSGYPQQIFNNPNAVPLRVRGVLLRN